MTDRLHESPADGAGHVMHHGRGPGHELLAWAFFAGRRRSVYRRLATLSGARPGDRVLDVGCGDGYLTRLMADQVGPAGPVLAIDPSPEAISRARRRTRASNCTFALGVAEDLDAAEDSYDVVVTSLAVHHLAEPSRPVALKEMRRVLRPGGHLLVAEFRPPRTRIGQTLIRPFISANMRHNSILELSDMLASAGFEAVTAGDLQPWIHYVSGAKPR